MPTPSSVVSSAQKLLVPLQVFYSSLNLYQQIASSAQSGPNRHRTTALSKLRYTISRPKPNYPPATSLAGLGMRELSDDEARDVYVRKGLEFNSQGEKWFTFEHSGAWREVERQFMGAVRSHGTPNFDPRMITD